jgi:hypothetical protein
MEKRKYFSVGRVRPFVLGLLVMIVGVFMEKWWWQLGLMIIIAVFVESYFHYRASD